MRRSVPARLSAHLRSLRYLRMTILLTTMAADWQGGPRGHRRIRVVKQGKLNRKEREPRKWVCGAPAVRATLRLRPGQALRESGGLNGPGWGRGRLIGGGVAKQVSNQADTEFHGVAI